MAREKSEEFFKRAQERIPGGVNSPVRAWQIVGGTPRFIAKGEGARIFDVDGKEYVDYVGSWGPLILGHGFPEVVAAVEAQVHRGTTFGAPTEAEVVLAEMVCDRIAGIEKLRLVSSGTEAVMSALRLARGYTGRAKIIKFDGCYHGHADSMLVQAGSGMASLGVPASQGVPPAFTQETLVVPYNDLGSVMEAFDRFSKNIAAVVVEPICGNMGVILPQMGFLEGLREVTLQHGALLIFDEVITGFRVAPGGAQELYGITPDLTCLGKILGGGLPLGAFGGRGEVMDLLAPEGSVYQAGTLSGNPLAVVAGTETLRILQRPGTYEVLEKKGRRIEAGLRSVLEKFGLQAAINRVASMLTLFFGVNSVRNAEDARGTDRNRFGRFFHGMLERGVYYPPSPYESAFISVAHTDRNLDQTVEAFEDWVRIEAAR